MSKQKNQKDDTLKQDMDEIEDQQRQEKRVLRQLIDKARDAESKYLAVAARMGTNKSYISSVPLKWFADINFAADLEIFDEYRDENGKSIQINNEDTLAMLSQRKPDWSRQLVMTIYLAIREHHKFPPALLVAYQDWVLDKNDDNWGKDGCALQDSIEGEALDSQGWVVNLNHENTKFYALDGQHRLMAIRGLRDLIQGNLSKKTNEGKGGNQFIKIEDILEISSENDEKKKNLKGKIESMLDDEKIGVEIIPAVQKGETQDKAFRRLRQIFVDVNQNARRLEEGELILLDEIDGFRIVARSVMISNKLFRNGDRIDMRRSQLSETSEYYTTLQTVADIAKVYLEQHDEFAGWNNEICGIKGAGRLRPKDTEIDAGKKKLTSYFNAIMALPSHQSMIQGTPVSELRSREDGGHDNVLFRPMTQAALASAIGLLEREKGLTLEQICKTLAKKDDSKHPDLKLTDAASPFFGILCDPVEKKMRRHDRYRKLAIEMFCHLLDGGTPDEGVRETLRENVFKSRVVIPEEGGKPAEAVNFDGKPVKFDKFQLPHPW